MIERRLRFINRFSLYLINKPETVAEHTYYVIFYSWKIAKEFEKRGVNINYKSLFEKAMLHDIEECITGDIWKFAKTKAIKKEIGNIAKSLPNDLYTIWKDSKDDSIEGQIISFVDKYEVLVQCLEEMRSGNKYMLDRFINQISHMDEKHPIFIKYTNEIKNMAGL